MASRGFVMKELFSARELAEEYGLDPIIGNPITYLILMEAG